MEMRTTARCERRFVRLGTIVAAIALCVAALCDAAVHVAGDTASTSVEDGPIALHFAHDDGSHRLHGLTVAGLPIARPGDFLWSAEFRHTSGRRVFVNSLGCSLRIESTDNAVSLVWADVELGTGVRAAVRVDILFRPEEMSTEWRIRFFRVPTDWTLFHYDFPCVNVVAEPGDDCALVEPQDWGEVTPDPLHRLARRWRAYPGSGMSMQFLALQRDDRLVYLGWHDPRARLKTFSLVPDPVSGCLKLAVRQPVRIAFGADYEQRYPFVLRVSHGGWYEAAQIYRRWALTAPWTWRGPLHAGRKTPESFQRTPLVLLRLGKEARVAAFVADWAIRTQKWFGLPATYHWYGWYKDYGSQSIDCYPHFFPARPGFPQAAKRMRAAGVGVMPYFNARLWRTDFPSWHEMGRRAAVRDVYGKRHNEVWMKIPAAVMNPASRLWEHVIGEQLLRSVDCGSNAVYLDQLAASAPWPSYDTDHPHTPGETGAWVQGYWRLCERLRAEGSASEPDLVLTAEGNAEPYLGVIDSFLCGNLNAPNSVPLYSAVYHDYVMQFGRYIMLQDLKLPRAVVAKFGQQFVFGGQFGWSRAPLDTFLDDANPQAVCLRKMAALRHASHELLAAGRMLAPLVFNPPVPALDVDWYQWKKRVSVRLPRVLSSAWQAADGTVGVVLLNIDDLATAVSFALRPSRYPVIEPLRARLRSADASGRVTDIPAVANAGIWHVAVPPLTPVLLVLDGKPTAHPSPPPKPDLDLLVEAPAAAPGVLPFAVPSTLARQSDSRLFPFRYEADVLPCDARPAWAMQSTGACDVADSLLKLDTLTAGRPTASLHSLPAGPAWDVDRACGFTVELRLRVIESNGNTRFGFWVQTNVGNGTMCLQVFPDRIVAAGQPPVKVDMKSAQRVVRVVGLPGGQGVRLYLDGQQIVANAAYLGGHPSQVVCAFGSGASAGRVKAEVDYVRLDPCRALAP